MMIGQTKDIGPYTGIPILVGFGERTQETDLRPVLATNSEVYKLLGKRATPRMTALYV